MSYIIKCINLEPIFNSAKTELVRSRIMMIDIEVWKVIKFITKQWVEYKITDEEKSYGIKKVLNYAYWLTTHGLLHSIAEFNEKMVRKAIDPLYVEEKNVVSQQHEYW